ncbi:MAG: glycosyltransferase family 39 protein [Deltaproteobacteria bacterium]|nr:glycosyltransferase family 39 protein [Deltaproteobacteria bacterium]
MTPSGEHNARVPRQVWWALLAGGLLRLVAAWWCDGYFASDCYFHVLDPAWRWLFEPDAPMPSNFRSAFLPLLLHGVMKAGRAVGMEAPTTLLHLSYTALGAWSLLSVVFTYRLARIHLSEAVSVVAAWLVAVQFMMPHVSTQALVESAAAPPMVAGLWLFERMRTAAHPRVADGVAAGACLGLAALFRFHVGLVFVVAVVLAARQHNRSRLILSLCAGGVLPALLQGFVDLHTQGGFFVVLFRYVDYQLQWANSYGVMPWHVFLAFFVGLTFPPLTAAIWRGMLDAARGMVTLTSALVVFAVVHSLVGHKEERFMFTVLPLFMVLLAAGLVDAWDSGARWRRAGVLMFAVGNAVLLGVFTLADPRRNVNEPLKELASQQPPAAVLGLGVGVRLAPLYAGWGAQVMEAFADEELFQKKWREELRGDQVRVVLGASHVNVAIPEGWTCSEGREFAGDHLDRFLILVNPQANRSRAPTRVRDCVRSAR